MKLKPLLSFNAIVAAMAVWSAPAQAETLRYMFTGEVSYVGFIYDLNVMTDVPLPFSVGETVSGVLDYTNSGIPDSLANTAVGRYTAAVNWVSFQAGAFSFGPAGTNPYQSQFQNASQDGMYLEGSLAGSVGTNALGAFEARAGGLRFIGPSTIFTSDALPAALPTGVSQWTVGKSGYLDVIGPAALYGSMAFNITSFEAVTSVPEPGTYALALLGLGAVAWRVRRKTG